MKHYMNQKIRNQTYVVSRYFYKSIKFHEADSLQMYFDLVLC